METLRSRLFGANVTTKTVMLIDEVNNLLFSIKSEKSKEQALEVYGNKEVIRVGTREPITTIQIKK